MSIEKIIQDLEDEIKSLEEFPPQYCWDPDAEVSSYHGKIHGLERALEIVKGYKE